MSDKKKYYLLRRTGIFFALLLTWSLIYTHTALNGNQIVADVSLLVLIIGCYGLRAR